MAGTKDEARGVDFGPCDIARAAPGLRQGLPARSDMASSHGAHPGSADVPALAQPGKWPLHPD